MKKDEWDKFCKSYGRASKRYYKLKEIYDAEIRKQKERTNIKCIDDIFGKGCGKRTQIKKLIYITVVSSTPGQGYDGPDWHYEHYFLCPKCGRKNRFYNREHYKDLKNNFGGQCSADGGTGWNSSKMKIDESYNDLFLEYGLIINAKSD